MEHVGYVSLINQGGFVCRMRFKYLDDTGTFVVTKETGDITLGRTDRVDPGNLGVPNGATFLLYVDVVWGTDNQASNMLIYEKGSNKCAAYNISGTSTINNLGFIGIKTV
jgi:hypothetical protein